MEENLMAHANVTPVFWIVVFICALFAIGAVSALVYAIRTGILHEVEDIKYRILDAEERELR